jgi:RNA polymerase sigma-70 factor (ECF subfamily)
VTDAEREEEGGHAQRRGPALALAAVARRRVYPFATRPSPAPPLDARTAALGEAETTTLEHEEDLALVRSIARRDREAFETLYYRYAPRLGRYAMRLLKQREAVDEVIDDVMLVVWQNAARFDPEVSRPSTWLFGITHHKVLKRLARSPSRGEALALDSHADAAAEGQRDAPAAPDPEQTAMGRELGMALADALSLLSADHRAVIELAFCENCSYQEIAAVTGCPVNTVKTRMFHARKHLARLLRERGETYGSTAQ